VVLRWVLVIEYTFQWKLTWPWRCERQRSNSLLRKWGFLRRWRSSEWQAS
jgi:hypothetical protein